MTLLTAATDAGRTITVTQDVPWGTIAIALAVVIVAGLYALLALKGKAPGIKAKVGDKEVELGDPDDKPEAPAYDGPDRRKAQECADPIDIKVIRLAQIVSRRRYEAADNARIRQKELTEEMEGDFWPIFDRLSVPDWQTESAWNRLALLLYGIADQNHLLKHVREGRADQDYLDSKVLVFKRRYEKMLKRDGCQLPDFYAIEEQFRSLLHTVLVQFALISQEEQDALRGFVDELKSTTDSDQVRDILDVSAGFEVA